MSIHEKIRDKASRYRHETALLLSELVQIPSYSGREEAVCSRIAEICGSFGFDEVRIDGMTITRGRFGGGTLVVLKSGTPTGDFSGGDFRSSGIFAGWNDSNGTAAGGDIPAELGGAFLAATTDGTVAGRYVAD